jgi:hypothetical protein
MNSHTYYGQEPNIATYGLWMDFTQIIWNATQAIGCWTQYCSDQGLADINGVALNSPLVSPSSLAYWPQHVFVSRFWC